MLRGCTKPYDARCRRLACTFFYCWIVNAQQDQFTSQTLRMTSSSIASLKEAQLPVVTGLIVYVTCTLQLFPLLSVSGRRALLIWTTWWSRLQLSATLPGLSRIFPVEIQAHGSIHDGAATTGTQPRPPPVSGPPKTRESEVVGVSQL